MNQTPPEPKNGLKRLEMTSVCPSRVAIRRAGEHRERDGDEHLVADHRATIGRVGLVGHHTH